MPIKKKLKSQTFITHEPILGFYDSIVPKGTILYVNNPISEGVKHDGRWHFRYIFDTAMDASGHDDPIGNIRCGIWFTQGAFELDIEPYKEE